MFADVDEYLCLDPESVASRITTRTRAVIFVGLGGNAGRLDAIARLCGDRGLKLIVDAAHMTGARLNGRHVGAEGDVSVFSFHAVKNLPTADSGMVCFADAELDAVARHWTWLGIDKDTYSRTHRQHLQMALPRSSTWASSARQLDHGGAGVGREMRGRRQRLPAWLAAWCDEGSPRRGISRPFRSRPVATSRHLYQVLVDRRDAVMVGLNNATSFPACITRTTAAHRIMRISRPVPARRRASERVISLPMHLRLERTDVRASGRAARHRALNQWQAIDDTARAAACASSARGVRPATTLDWQRDENRRWFSDRRDFQRINIGAGSNSIAIGTTTSSSSSTRPRR